MTAVCAVTWAAPGVVHGLGGVHVCAGGAGGHGHRCECGAVAEATGVRAQSCIWEDPATCLIHGPEVAR